MGLRLRPVRDLNALQGFQGPTLPTSSSTFEGLLIGEVDRPGHTLIYLDFDHLYVSHCRAKNGIIEKPPLWLTHTNLLRMIGQHCRSIED